MKDDYIKNMTNAERRFFKSELRAPQGESRTVEGYAAVFNSDSEVFWDSWIERIAPGAFDGVLQDDAVALFNHDPNFILARNKVNMTITQDERGLKYVFDAPNTTAGNDLLENLRNGNIYQSSFAFTVKEEKMTNPSAGQQYAVRTILKVARLYDVSPVTYPAYPDTSVGKRSFDSLIKSVSNEAAEKAEREKRYKLMQNELFKLKNS